MVGTHLPPRRVAWADVDRDDAVELLFSDGNRSMTVLHHTGDLVFGEGQSYDARRSDALALIDADGDGDLDVASAPDWPSEVRIDIAANQARP